MHCVVHEIMGSRNLTGGKKGVNLAKKGVKIEFPILYLPKNEFLKTCDVLG